MSALEPARSLRERHGAHPGVLRPGGFTLLELVIVLAIIGIIAAFAAPRVNFTQYRMDAGVRLLATTLQRAQRLAITRQYDVIVSFDVAGRRMRLLEDADNDGAISAGDRQEWKSLEDGVQFATPSGGLTGPAGDAVVGANLRTVAGMPTLIFRRDGSASTDLEVYVSAGRTNQNDFRAVSVVEATGRTQWFRYIGGQWKPGGL